eukprot:7992123-Lingulodinium_polyedra.AAC.1
MVQHNRVGRLPRGFLPADEGGSVPKVAREEGLSHRGVSWCRRPDVPFALPQGFLDDCRVL